MSVRARSVICRTRLARGPAKAGRVRRLSGEGVAVKDEKGLEREANEGARRVFAHRRRGPGTRRGLIVLPGKIEFKTKGVWVRRPSAPDGSRHLRECPPPLARLYSARDRRCRRPIDRSKRQRVRPAAGHHAEVRALAAGPCSSDGTERGIRAPTGQARWRAAMSGVSLPMVPPAPANSRRGGVPEPTEHRQRPCAIARGPESGSASLPSRRRARGALVLPRCRPSI